MDSDNPYESPLADCIPKVLVPSSPDVVVMATLVQRKWLYRRLRLTGGLEAEITWNGRGPMETVRLNGRLAAWESPFWYAPHFAFGIETTSGSRRADVEIRMTWLLPFVGIGFRLRIDDAIVYSEGHWPDSV